MQKVVILETEEILTLFVAAKRHELTCAVGIARCGMCQKLRSAKEKLSEALPKVAQCLHYRLHLTIVLTFLTGVLIWLWDRQTPKNPAKSAISEEKDAKTYPGHPKTV